MQKQKLTIVCLVVFFVIAAMTVSAGNVAWFDMKNCDMCKGMIETPGLMEHITWEQHDISNGVVAITSVSGDFKEAYDVCDMKMKAMGEKMMAGEKLNLCGSCMAFGGLMQKGVKFEKIATNTGHLSIFTADNDELVTELKAWSAKNKEEMKKMAMTEK